MDSGASHSWINSKCLPKGTITTTTDKIQNVTLAGAFTSSDKLILNDAYLPEFHRHRRIRRVDVNVFNNPECRYDMLLGRDILSQLGIIVDFKEHIMEWDEATVDMRNFPSSNAFPLNESQTLSVAEHLMHELLFSDYLPNSDTFAASSVSMEANSYRRFDIPEIIGQCNHLTSSQQEELTQVLLKYPRLFSGHLRKFPDYQVHLELNEGAVPHRSRAYAVPHTHKSLFKDELERLCKEDVVEKASRAEWIAGTFIVPKKNNQIRWVTDFRGLNKYLRRRVYPMPKIMDILSRRSGYKYLTKLDLSMHYYSFELDEKSRELTTFATPHGLYRYKRLPQGLSQSPDIAQEAMDNLFEDVEEVECYMDDIAAFSDDWRKHLQVLDRILSRLEKKGFAINPEKCQWGVQETDFLGHWLTPEGIKPYRKKVEAILAMQPPTNISELRSYLGMVNWYRDMWPRRTHVLAPLTELTGKKTFIWGPSQQQAFKSMQSLCAKDVMLTYPDHNKPFDVETDASDYQLGAVIKQDGKPVAYYSRKLNSAQKNYTTIEKELLSIVETLKTFRTMLLGTDIRVHTDHKNLSHRMTNYVTQRVLRWRLLLEEYGPSFHYKKGPDNVVADAMSRVPTAITKWDDSVAIRKSNDSSAPSTILDDSFLAECFLQHPSYNDADIDSPFHFVSIRALQQKCDKLKDKVTRQPEKYKYKNLGGHQVICFTPTDSDWKIALSDDMMPKFVKWYHEATSHAEGSSRLLATLSRNYHHADLAPEVKQQMQKCDECKKLKRVGGQYGMLAPREAPLVPWQEIHTDCIGPWTFKLRRKEISFCALTTIDPVTNLMEVNRIRTKSAIECAEALENNWLARYPRPLKCVHDNGPEFVGQDFQDLLERAGIRSRPSTSRNPQGNSIIESVHKTVGSVIRTLIHIENPHSVAEAERLVDRALATAMHATRCAAHSSLKNLSPGSIVFHRDMYLDIPLHADVLVLHENRQKLIDSRLLEANAKRFRHEFKVGHKIMKRNVLSFSDKLKPAYRGPYEIIQVHTNGTVTIQLDANSTERINIRRIKPA